MTSTNGRGLKRAILYARVSTDDERIRSECSLALQLEAFCGSANREGYKVLEAAQILARAGQVSSGLAWTG